MQAGLEGEQAGAKKELGLQGWSGNDIGEKVRGCEGERSEVLVICHDMDE